MGEHLRDMDRDRVLGDLKEAYETGGLTVRELALLYGVSYSTMHARLVTAGVVMRPRNDHPPIGEPVVPPRSVPCPKCGAPSGTKCMNTYGWHINDLHVARRRAAVHALDSACET